MEQLFLKRRGKNVDIDWRGLKDILDYAMREGAYFIEMPIINHLLSLNIISIYIYNNKVFEHT